LPGVSLRPRRQITLPREVCRQLGIDIGDRLDLAVEDGVLVGTPSRKRALDALQEIQAAFSRSGVGERELQRAARQARSELTRERHGRKRPA
jgi:bifunctional DNA-binding transcriptional regulator/antitoxin component of YhaV-PrlF toxin-antitoxin module